MHAYHAVATCVLASSLTKRAPRYTSPRVPRSGRSSSFGWVEGRRLLVERGSGAEVATFLERHPQYPEDDLQTVLSYFDAALLAPAVGCPTVSASAWSTTWCRSPAFRRLSSGCGLRWRS